jgi:hypothetical protein
MPLQAVPLPTLKAVEDHDAGFALEALITLPYPQEAVESPT